MTITHTYQISLAPGFSPVCGGALPSNRFSGFPHARKPLKRLNEIASFITGLRPGANESSELAKMRAVHNLFVNRKS